MELFIIWFMVAVVLCIWLLIFFEDDFSYTHIGYCIFWPAYLVKYVLLFLREVLKALFIDLIGR